MRRDFDPSWCDRTGSLIDYDEKTRLLEPTKRLCEGRKRNRFFCIIGPLIDNDDKKNCLTNNYCNDLSLKSFRERYRPHSL